MENNLTPEIVIDRATKAHMTLSQFLKRAQVNTSSFYRWKNGETGLSRVSMQKVSDALEGLESAPKGAVA